MQNSLQRVELSSETQTLTIKGELSANDAAQIATAFASPEARDRVRRSLKLFEGGVDRISFVSWLDHNIPFMYVFQEGSYAYDRIYQGSIKLHKHFFPVIGNLKSEGEEFQCAQFIANEWEEVDTWVRNVERKPSSFWLQTATDRFYPDFVLRMKDARILVLEYKGAHLAETEDSREKEQIGKLWAAASGGRCAFAMVSELRQLFSMR